MENETVPLPERIGRLGEIAFRPLVELAARRAGPVPYARLLHLAFYCHNPMRILRVIPRERLEGAARDPGFLARYDSTIAALDKARAGEGTWGRRRLNGLDGSIAVLLGGVRAAPVAADLRRWAWRPCR